MAKDNRTYGFSLTDAESLAELIGGRAMIVEGRSPVGGGNNIFGFKATSAIGQSSGTASIYPMSDATYGGTPLKTGAEIRASVLFGLLAINTLGVCALIAGTYYVIQAGCPLEEEYI